MKSHTSIFWDITQCSPFKVNRAFAGTCRLQLQCLRVNHVRNQQESQPTFHTKRPLTFNGLHDVISQKTEFFIVLFCVIFLIHQLTWLSSNLCNLSNGCRTLVQRKDQQHERYMINIHTNKHTQPCGNLWITRLSVCTGRWCHIISSICNTIFSPSEGPGGWVYWTDIMWYRVQRDLGWPKYTPAGHWITWVEVKMKRCCLHGERR
jgi:hypothetical protein